MSPTKAELEEIRATVGALAEEVTGLRGAIGTLADENAQLRRALCELGLAVSEDIAALSPLNPLSRSIHVQTRLRRIMPGLVPMVESYLRAEDTWQAEVQRKSEEMQAVHAAAEQGRSEGAVFDRHAGQREAKKDHYRQAALSGDITPSHPGGGQ